MGGRREPLCGHRSAVREQLTNVKNKIHRLGIVLLIGACLGAADFSTSSQQAPQVTGVRWRDCLRQRPEWYASAEAVRIADNVLLYQRAAGGWPKNTEMAAVLTEKQVADLVAQKNANDATIDNDGTYTQLAFLARMLKATQNGHYQDAFFKGLDFLLVAQYENGGWPQFYPHPAGYQKHITFNDDAMIGVMNLMREIARKDSNYAFVDEQRRAKAERAGARGIECILKCQIKVQGKLTAWCAQHDETTFAPASARTYEKISLSGGESVGIVRFLMGIEHPTRPVIEAIRSAVTWLDEVKIHGISVIDKPDKLQARGFDRVVVDDPKAEPLWARFYEIGTNRPIFCGRDGVIKYTFAEIEYERRTGYRWYLNTPAKLLATEYPAWRKQHGLK